MRQRVLLSCITGVHLLFLTLLLFSSPDKREKRVKPLIVRAITPISSPAKVVVSAQQPRSSPPKPAAAIKPAAKKKAPSSPPKKPVPAKKAPPPEKNSRGSRVQH